MLESRWISLNADEIAPASHPVDADWIEEAPSPYDVPTHARSFYDEASGVLTIEFRYISSERTEEVELNPYLKATFGKASRRVYVVKLDVHSFNRDKKRMAVATTDSLCAYSGMRGANRSVAIKAIERKQGALFAAVGY